MHERAWPSYGNAPGPRQLSSPLWAAPAGPQSAARAAALLLPAACIPLRIPLVTIPLYIAGLPAPSRSDSPGRQSLLLQRPACPPPAAAATRQSGRAPMRLPAWQRSMRSVQQRAETMPSWPGEGPRKRGAGATGGTQPPAQCWVQSNTLHLGQTSQTCTAIATATTTAAAAGTATATSLTTVTHLQLKHCNKCRQRGAAGVSQAQQKGCPNDCDDHHQRHLQRPQAAASNRGRRNEMRGALVCIACTCSSPGAAARTGTCRGVVRRGKRVYASAAYKRRTCTF